MAVPVPGLPSADPGDASEEVTASPSFPAPALSLVLVAGSWPGVVRVQTNAVVAILVVLSVDPGVGAVGVPVNAGLASGAKPEMRGCTNAVVASLVLLSAPDGVGALGVPVKAGLASGASNAALACTCAVVAILVELSAVGGVGAVGVPVKAGESFGIVMIAS